MKQLSKLILSIIVALSMPTAARAITGYFDDWGGGRYWCNVYVASVTYYNLAGRASMSPFEGVNIVVTRQGGRSLVGKVIMR